MEGYDDATFPRMSADAAVIALERLERNANTPLPPAPRTFDEIARAFREREKKLMESCMM